MSDPIQKPIDQKDQEQIPAGGTPAEAPKPKEPSHEEILTGFSSEAKKTTARAKEIVKEASDQIAAMEKRKNDTSSAAKIELDIALKNLEQKNAVTEEQILAKKQEKLELTRKAVEKAKKNLQERFEILSSNLSDPSEIEQLRKQLEDKSKLVDDIKSKDDAEQEANYMAAMEKQKEKDAKSLLEIETNDNANMSIIKAMDEKIAKVKSEKETKLKGLWSAKLDEKIDEIAENEQPDEEVRKSVICSGVKGAILATAALLMFYSGLKHNSRVPTHQSVPSLFVSSDSMKSFVPLASTGLAGLAKPAMAPKKEVKAAPKAIEKKNVKKEVDARKAYKRFTLAILRIWPEIKTFNDDGPLFQKSPRKSLKVFCTYAVDNASKLSSEQRAAIAELLFTIKNARPVGALGKDESDLSALNSIRRRGMKPSEMRYLAKRIQAAIKEKKAHLAMNKKSKKAKAPAAKASEKLVDMSEHVKNEIARIGKENERQAKKEGADKPAAKPIAVKVKTGIIEENLMQKTTS